MPVVYTSFIISAFVALLISFTNFKKFNKITFILLLFFNIAIVGLRSEYVGADSLQYYLAFNELNEMSFTQALMTRYAQGYILLTRFVGYFARSPYVFFFITALFTISIYFFYLKRFSKNVFFAIIVFFCLNWTLFIAAMRQSYALSFILLGLPFLLNRKKVIFSLFVLIAMQFHSSAFVALCLLPLSSLTINKKTICIFLTSAIFIFSSMTFFWQFVSKYGGVYASYAISVFNTAGTNIVNDIIIKIIPSLIIFGIAFWGTKEKRDHVTNFFLLVCLLNLCIGIVGLNSLIITRLNGYFDFANPVVATYFLSSNTFRRMRTKIATCLCIIAFFVALFTVIQIERPNWMKITPYSPYWQPINAYGMTMEQYFW